VDTIPETAGDEIRFSDPERGASDQSFRMIVRPDVWGAREDSPIERVWDQAHHF
jgi:hypothetical protein